MLRSIYVRRYLEQVVAADASLSPLRILFRPPDLVACAHFSEPGFLYPDPPLGAYELELLRKLYTRALFELVDLYGAPLRGKPRPHIVNFLPWPRWHDLTDEEEARLEPYVRFVRVERPAGLAFERRQEQALALTTMRESAHEFVHERGGAQVVMGGKVSGFSGYLPGLLEETHLAVTHHTPVFIIGAFGGAAEEIGNAVVFREGKHDRFEWQPSNYPTARQLMMELRERGPKALHNGLSEGENREMVRTRDVNRALQLTVKGLAEIAKRSA